MCTFTMRAYIHGNRLYYTLQRLRYEKKGEVVNSEEERRGLPRGDGRHRHARDAIIRLVFRCFWYWMIGPVVRRLGAGQDRWQERHRDRPALAWQYRRLSKGRCLEFEGDALRSPLDQT